MVITSEAYLLLDIVHTAYLVVVVLSNCSVPNLSSFIRVYYVLCSMTIKYLCAHSPKVKIGVEAGARVVLKRGVEAGSDTGTSQCELEPDTVLYYVSESSRLFSIPSQRKHSNQEFLDTSRPMFIVVSRQH